MTLAPGPRETEALGDGPVEGLESLRSLWPAVVELVRVENALLGALIAEAQPVEVAEEDLTVGFASTARFLKKKAEDGANRVTVTTALNDVTGRRWRVSYELRDELDAHERPARKGHTEEEWVRRFMEEFDAEELPGEWQPAQGRDSSRRGGEGGEPVTSSEKGA